MNIEIKKSEFVDIEGLTEACVASPDQLLVVIMDFIKRVTSYWPDDVITDEVLHNPPWPPLMQLEAACGEELERRHGVDDKFDSEAVLKLALRRLNGYVEDM